MKHWGTRHSDKLGISQCMGELGSSVSAPSPREGRILFPALLPTNCPPVNTVCHRASPPSAFQLLNAPQRWGRFLGNYYATQTAILTSSYSPAHPSRPPQTPLSLFEDPSCCVLLGGKRELGDVLTSCGKVPIALC